MDITARKTPIPTKTSVVLPVNPCTGPISCSLRTVLLMHLLKQFMLTERQVLASGVWLVLWRSKNCSYGCLPLHWSALVCIQTCVVLQCSLPLFGCPHMPSCKVCTVLKAVLMLHLASTLDLVVFANAFLHKLTEQGWITKPIGLLFEISSKLIYSYLLQSLVLFETHFNPSLTSRAKVEILSKSSNFDFERKMSAVRAFF